MRSLVESRVVTRAGIAALATTLACYPRLATWLERTHSVELLCLVMLWTTFVLWEFVLGWQEKYAGRPPFKFEKQPRLWAIATGYGVAAAVLLRLFFDPTERVITPGEYPTDWQSWISVSLFNLSLSPLFLCFAPFAFFVRLSKRTTTAMMLTVTFCLFILYLKLGTPHAPPKPGGAPTPPAFTGTFVLILMARSLVSSYLSVWFFLKGGVWVIWWILVIEQLRHLIGFVGT